VDGDRRAAPAAAEVDSLDRPHLVGRTNPIPAREAAMRASLGSLLLVVAATAVADAQVMNGELGYTLTVPEGFVAYPAGKTSPDIVDCWVERTPASDAGAISLCVQRLRGTLSREPMTADELGSPNLLLTSFRWNEFDIEGVEGVATPDNGQTSTFVAQIPLQGEAIQLIARGPGNQRARVRAVMTSTLISLVGESDWVSDSGRFAWLERTVTRFLSKIVAGAVILIVATLWGWIRSRREPEPATA
jgi:hypothetical protein